MWVDQGFVRKDMRDNDLMGLFMNYLKAFKIRL